MIKQAEKPRPIDVLAGESYSFWKRGAFYLAKTKVRTWKGAVILAFFAGIVFTFLMVNAFREVIE